MNIENMDYTGPAIYSIWSNIDDKIYIGQSCNYRKRVVHHKNVLKINKHANPYIQRQYNKGKEVLNISIIETPPIEELNDREVFWISFLGTTDPSKGYNMTKGGDNYFNNKWSEEKRINMSKRMKDRWENGEFDTPYIKTREQIERCNIAIKEAYRKNGKRGEKIRVSNLQGEIIGEYKSMRVAAKANGLGEQTISKVLRKKLSAVLPEKELLIERLTTTFIDKTLSEDIKKRYRETRGNSIIITDKENTVLCKYISLSEACRQLDVNYWRVTDRIRVPGRKYYLKEKECYIQKALIGIDNGNKS